MGFDGVAKLLLESAVEGAGAGVERPAVDAFDRDQFGAGAGEEAFIGGVEVVGSEASFMGGNVVVTGQFEDQPAGDAGECTVGGGGCEQFAMADDEEVVGGAFGDVALGIEQDGFVGAGVVGFDPGEDVVEVVEAFDSGVEAVGWQAAGGGNDQVGALVSCAGVDHVEVVTDDGQAGLMALPRVDAQRARAAGQQDAQVAVGRIECIDQALYDLPELSVVPGVFEGDGTGRVLQPVEVVIEQEGLTMVETDAFEDAVAV